MHVMPAGTAVGLRRGKTRRERSSAKRIAAQVQTRRRMTQRSNRAMWSARSAPHRWESVKRYCGRTVLSLLQGNRRSVRPVKGTAARRAALALDWPARRFWDGYGVGWRFLALDWVLRHGQGEAGGREKRECDGRGSRGGKSKRRIASGRRGGYEEAA